MNLRQRLTLSTVTVLILFVINAGMVFWSKEIRSESIIELRQAVSGQFQAATIQQNLINLRKAVLLLSSLRSTLNEMLTSQEINQALREINHLERQLETLGKTVSFDTMDHFSRLSYEFGILKPLWSNFYNRYNEADYLHYREGDAREHAYVSTMQELKKLETALIKSADKQSMNINQLEDWTSLITAAVLLLSITLSIVMGWSVLRFTNNSLRTLKKGANLLGGGELDYRIPVTSNDELGEVAKAFNIMSAKLQNAITEVQRAKESADKASEAKSDFLANMSHELRTPLNAIIGYTEILIEDIELDDANPESQLQDLKKVLDAGRHLLTQINDVLDFSKIETGKMTVYNEEFDSQKILQDVIATISPLAKKSDNELSFIGCPNMPVLINDVTKFRQIFFNLLSNACKFTTNGQITLHCEYDRTTTPPIARFSVTDNGIGMNSENLERVFEAFVQADSSTTRRYGGTGLGLALCKQYSQLMGGRIEVNSRVNTGTTFCVEFPATPLGKVAPHTLPSDVVSPPEPTQQINILVIDDDPVALALTKRYLHRQEYRFFMASTGKEGLSLAEKYHPDIVLLDLMMPEIDGWTVLSSLKQNPSTQDIPVIVLTMLDESELGGDLDIKGYLRKPIDWIQLENLIHDILPDQE